MLNPEIAEVLAGTRQWCVVCGDAREKLRELPAGSVHCIVTSPPYFGLRAYKSGDAEIGRERLLEDYISNLMAVMAECWRVLRDDGLLFVNIGDSQAAGKGASGQGIAPDEQECRRASGESINRACHQIGGKGKTRSLDDRAALRKSGLKPGDLCGVPWRFAFAMQAAGWYLRRDIIWVKAVSLGPEALSGSAEWQPPALFDEPEFQPKIVRVEDEDEPTSGSTMPESVDGVKWERHEVEADEWKAWKRLEPGDRTSKATWKRRIELPDWKAWKEREPEPKWRDCPGCPKCLPTGGYILRRSNWRPTRAHEYIFQFAKSNDYWADREAVKEGCVPYEVERRRREKAQGLDTRYTLTRDSDGFAGQTPPSQSSGCRSAAKKAEYVEAGRNLRDCWWIQPGGNSDVSGSHFAMFPSKLPEVCIKASTSDAGVCPKCGAQWARVVIKQGEPKYTEQGNPQGVNRSVMSWGDSHPVKNPARWMPTVDALGWRPTCTCWLPSDPTPADWLPLVPPDFKPIPATVLDPFAGLATTGVVALKLGRSFVGIELNPDYCRLAEDRLRRECGLLAEAGR